MSGETKGKRPGLVTFAAIMLFVVAGMQLLMAIDQFQSASWLKDVSFGLFGQDYTTSGIIDLILAVGFIAAGVSVWRGHAFGRWVAIIAASLSAIRTFWFIWWFPLPALIIIAIDIAIVYAMIMHSDYFE